MLKKTLLSAAIASSFALSGCLDDSPSTTENAGSVTNPPVVNGVFPVFSPSESKFPIPNDLLFASETAGDGTFVDLGVPNPLDPATAASYNPVFGAIGGLSGNSTVAPIDIEMSGLIDPSSIVSSGPDQNVFLIRVTYNSGEPVRALTIAEPPLPSGQPDFEVEVPTLDGTSYIRINPKEVLDPKRRYIVAITDTVLDMSGDPITQSPGAAGYAALADEDNPLTGSLAALAGVQTLINALWEPSALAYINNVNSLRGENPSAPVAESNLALTYSFTTSGDEKVLNYIADPAQWFTDQIDSFVKLGVAEATIATAAANNTTASFADIAAALSPTTGAYAVLPNIPINEDGDTLRDALDGYHTGNAFPAVGCTGSETGTAYTKCVGQIMAMLPQASGGFSDLLPTPSSTTSNFTNPAVDHPTLNNVAVIQGTISVPYYSRPPADIGTGADPGDNAGAGAPLKYLSWEASEELATAVNFTFKDLGLELAQGRTLNPAADAATATITDFDQEAKSSYVNYVFPFPKQQDGDLVTVGTQNLDIPITIVYPKTNAGDLKSMIIGHGLGGSRNIAVSVGAELVQNAPNFAVVAIDQPLHGMTADYEVDTDGDPDTDGNTTLLTQTANERHFGYAEAGPGLPPRALQAGDNLSLLFVNIESFLTTRDNNRQNALDLLTLRKSIGSIDITGIAGGASDLDPENVYYQGYSLGTISAQAMVAVANDANQSLGPDAALGAPGSAGDISKDDIKSAFFSTPGGGIARFFESSPAFAGSIVDGLASQGLTSDTFSYQAYINTLQSALDAFDGINFVGDYEGQGTNVLYYTASNDQVIPVSQVPGNTLFAPAGTLGSFEINASVSYLSGAEPLLTEANVTAIEAAGFPTVDRAVIRFKPGAGSHGGPCPATENADPTLDGPTVFGSWALSMIDNDSAATGTNDDGTYVLGVPAVAQSDWIDAAPIQPFFIDALQCSPASS